MAFYNEKIINYYIDLLINKGLAKEEDRTNLAELFFTFHKCAVENARNWERYNNGLISATIYEKNNNRYEEKFKSILKMFKNYGVKKIEFPGLYPVLITNNEIELFIFQ